MSQSPLLLHGDCKEVLKTLAPDSIEAAVSDPPYGLGDMSPARVAECLAAWTRGEEYQPTGAGFMGKAWDAWTPGPDMWRELYRVLKPGAHALIFAGSRTQDLMSLALRLAGFEIRDTLQWLYSSGFPKSHNIDKAINKSAPATDAARAWEGWGTALKPAYEPIILARKPLAGTVVQNTLEHGCGGLNIGGCRVGDEQHTNFSWRNKPNDTVFYLGLYGSPKFTTVCIGRWPANVLLDEGAAEVLDAQAPGASRFFYTAKASRAEREAGLSAYAGTRGAQPRANTHPTVKPIELMRYLVRLITPPGASVIDPFMGSGSTGCAAVLEGARFVGIEREAEYMNIARARIAHHTPAPPSPAPPSPADEQLSLFDTDTGTQEP